MAIRKASVYAPLIDSIEFNPRRRRVVVVIIVPVHVVDVKIMAVSAPPDMREIAKSVYLVFKFLK
jgi:hypothetical protein